MPLGVLGFWGFGVLNLALDGMNQAESGILKTLYIIQYLIINKQNAVI